MTDAKRATPREGGPLQNLSRRQGSVSTPTNANQELSFHPLADIFPLMEGAEFDALVADIKANGLRQRIVIFEGKILDGRNRYRACLAAGKRPLFRPANLAAHELYAFKDPAKDPVAFVISANIHRRHLTPEQKREIIAKLIKAQPEKSNRQIAKVAKADDKTVGAVRVELESTAEIPQLEKRVGKDGKARKQPAKKAKPAKAAAVGDVAALVADLCIPRPSEQQKERIRRLNEKADKVVAILIERLGRDGLGLIAAALSACGIGGFQSAIDRQIEGTPDEKLVADCSFDCEKFIAKFGKLEPAANDDGLDIPECLRRTPKVTP
jgi:hypothetical protein